MPGRRHRLLVCLVTAIAACTGAARADDSGVDDEAAVRAAFLFRLAFFVSWPAQTFARPDSPIRICLEEAPPAPLARVLRTQTASRTVQERPVEIVALAAGQPADGCHLLYAQDGDRAPTAPAYALVVVDSLDRLRRAGALALVRETSGAGTRLVFYADRQRLGSAPYAVSAQLLRLVRFAEGGG